MSSLLIESFFSSNSLTKFAYIAHGWIVDTTPYTNTCLAQKLISLNIESVEHSLNVARK